MFENMSTVPTLLLSIQADLNVLPILLPLIFFIGCVLMDNLNHAGTKSVIFIVFVFRMIFIAQFISFRTTLPRK